VLSPHSAESAATVESVHMALNAALPSAIDGTNSAISSQFTRVCHMNIVNQ